MRNNWLDELLQKRLLMVTGKGGTGKSTCVAALAVLAARRGLRPLVIELESNSTARSIFGVKKTGLLPKKTPAGVDIVSVGFQAGIEELVHDVMKVPRMVRVLLRHPVISRFLRATPSALDFIALFLTHRFINATNSRGEPEHGIVLMDMPAFGHAQQMLGVGRNIRDLLRVGPIATRAAAIDEMLHDSEQTSVVVVTLPEEMPVTETIHFYSALREELQMPVGPILVNCNHPELIEEQAADAVESVARAADARGDEESAFALRHAAERSRWAAERNARTAALESELPDATLTHIPLFPGAVAGMTLLDNVAESLVVDATEGESP